jgi:hypothetical protein
LYETGSSIAWPLIGDENVNIFIYIPLALSAERLGVPVDMTLSDVEAKVLNDTPAVDLPSCVVKVRVRGKRKM